MSDNTGTLATIVLMVILSAYFSATETAFSSMNRIRLRSMANGGNKKAALALRLSDDYDKLLSSILIGNNIVNIASASLATIFFTRLLSGSSSAAPLSTLVMTVVVLIFGEVTPKSIAKDMPEQFAMFSAPILNILVKILTPINYLFSCWKRFIRRLIKTPEEVSVTEEEILTLVDTARSEGTLDSQESVMIHEIIEFSDLQAEDVLTPRVKISAIENTASNEEISGMFMDSGYSRLPVYEEDMDHIIGVLHQKDFYGKVLSQGKELKDVMSAILYVAPSTKISQLLKLFQRERSHIAVVIDEYGGTEGIVTLEDVIEEIVGEIWDEHDTVTREIESIGEQRWRVLGSTRIDHLFDVLGWDEDEDMDCQSVSGWVMDKMGSIPKADESFVENGVLVKVTQSDGRSVQEVEISKAPLEEPEKRA